MIILVLIFSAVSLLIFFLWLKPKGENDEVLTEVMPVRGLIQSIISTTATVLPKNRLEIKPSVGGRVEEVLVKEGEKIKTGQVLAWMSSTERAALLDSARSKGEEELKYWQEVYKPISLISPIEAKVIVAKVQPGQVVTTNDAVVVLSDQLIVKAQVDEVDIGKIQQGQEVIITLDAYPDTKINGKVQHIYYESKTANNVTIYEVDVLPQDVFEFFRSGMNASVDFVEKSKNNALLIPQEAVIREKEEVWVLLKQDHSREPQRVSIKLGISGDKNVEVLSGISEKDIIIIKSKKYSIPKTQGTNPFMPFRRR